MSFFCERSNKLKQRHSSEDSRSFQAGFSAVAGDKELIILCALYESVFTLATESFCDHVTSPGEFTDLFNKTAVWCCTACANRAGEIQGASCFIPSDCLWAQVSGSGSYSDCVSKFWCFLVSLKVSKCLSLVFELTSTGQYFFQWKQIKFN